MHISDPTFGSGTIRVCLVLSLGLLIVGTVIMTLGPVSAYYGCLPDKDPSKPCHPYDPGNNNSTRSIGQGTTNGGSSGGVLHK